MTDKISSPKDIDRVPDSEYRQPTIQMHTCAHLHETSASPGSPVFVAPKDLPLMKRSSLKEWTLKERLQTGVLCPLFFPFVFLYAHGVPTISDLLRAMVCQLVLWAGYPILLFSCLTGYKAPSEKTVIRLFYWVAP